MTSVDIELDPATFWSPTQNFTTNWTYVVVGVSGMIWLVIAVRRFRPWSSHSKIDSDSDRDRAVFRKQQNLN